MGSYPQFGSGRPSTDLVLRAADEARLAIAADAVRAMVDGGGRSRRHQGEDLT